MCVSGQSHTTAVYIRERLGTHCVGGLVGPREVRNWILLTYLLISFVLRPCGSSTAQHTVTHRQCVNESIGKVIKLQARCDPGGG